MWYKCSTNSSISPPTTKMEADPYLQSISIPMEYGQFDIHGHDGIDLFPSFTHDDVCMDAMLYDDHGIFMSLDEAQLPSNCDVATKESPPLQENLVAAEKAHDFPELSLTDLLLMSAEAIDSEKWQLASDLIARLDHLLFNVENETSPFLRLAYLFTQGLRSRLARNPPVVSPQQVLVPSADDMSAYQIVQELSPYVKFRQFAANQAILEATEGNRDIHIIDFNVMEGIQWPALMVDLVTRDGASLRITATVMDANDETVQRTGRQLVEFAESIGLTLRFDQVKLNDLEKLQVCRGSVIANCVLVQSQIPSERLVSISTFLTKLKKLSPKMVVLAEEEILASARKSSMPFVEFFCEALHHFSSVSDSLVSSFYGGYEIGLRLVEKEMLGPRVIDYVSQFPFGSFGMEEGFKLSPLSSFNVSQAKYLLTLFNRGFSVQYENGRLALCWKSRPLVAISIWVPI